MILFTVATLTPLALICAASVYGGGWAALALLWMTGITAGLDELVKRVSPQHSGEEFPAVNGLSVLLALGHFGALGLTVWALSGDGLAPLAKVGLFLAMGLFAGQVSNSNAHELIHRGARGLHRLGMWVYISLLFGHHTSAHVLVHHMQVGTRADPNTARMGESLYRFIPRAWVGSFRAGYRAERDRLARAGKPRWRHPYLTYFGGAAVFGALALWIGGVAGLWAYVSLAGFAQLQLMMNDYVQHYGLSRANKDSGKPEPVNARHSWNSPHWFSSGLMLNAPRHSDHHAHPSRPYAALAREDQLEWATVDDVTKAVRTFLDPVLAGDMAAAWRPLEWVWQEK